MRNAVLGTIALAVFGAGFLAGGWHRQREAVGAASWHGRKVLYYVDPMHPAYKSDKPGIAPDCGMRLEPVFAQLGDGTDDRPPSPSIGVVQVSPEQQQLIGVRLAAVSRSPVTESLRLYGRVAPDETRAYTVDIGTDGYIREVSRVTTGSRVRKGEWLATFSAPELRLALQGYLVALEITNRSRSTGAGQAQIAAEQATLQQSMDRLLTYGISRPQLDEISRTRVTPSAIKILAPADGVVLSRNVSIGQKFSRGAELYRLADLRRVWILSSLSGVEGEHVRPGAIARVTARGFSGALRARVSTDVLPQFDEVTQATQLRLEAENPDYILRPGMFVDVDLPVTLPAAIAVPAEAVVDSGLGKSVFVEAGEGIFQARAVRTGWRIGDRVEIVEGLSEGERIVVSGTFLLDSETHLQRAQPVSRSPR